MPRFIISKSLPTKKKKKKASRYNYQFIIIISLSPYKESRDKPWVTLIFEYSVSLRPHSTAPLTAEVTCTEVLRKKIQLSTDETNSFFLPEQTIFHHTSFIPLNEPNLSTDTQNDVAVDIIRSPNETTVISRPSKATNNNYSLNCTRTSEIMRSFGVTEYACTSILREIDMVITSSSSRGRGVIEIKIWKIKTEIYEVNRAAEKLMIESCCSNSLRVFGYNSNESTTDEKECVICMEDYTQGSLVTKLPCNHDFHGVCIYKWLHINHVCPLCRSPIPKDVQFQYESSFGSIFRFFSL